MANQLGTRSIVQVDYQEPDLRYDLAHGTGDDPYDGPMDRFGRVTDLLWRDYGSSTDAVRIKHGYDRAGNRLWREDPVAAGYGKHFDELYTYDGMYQLTNMQRGNLDFTDPDNPVILSKNFAEDWSLDMTGNWSTYRQDDDGDGTWDLNQSRTHNAVNEITQIAGASTHVAHDRCGNMTRTPKPDDWNAHYDLTYDPWNRLVRVEDGGASIAQYTYDARDFPVVKKLYDCSGASSSSSSSSSASGEPCETRHFFYNSGWQCLEERVESGGELSTNADRHFLWGQRYVDDLILRDRDTGANGTLDERLYAMQDSNWNVACVGDEQGGIEERYVDRAYGVHTVLGSTFVFRAGSQYEWTHRYKGRQSEARAGLTCFGDRCHAAELGRFLSRCIFHEERPKRETLTYVLNNPLRFVAPRGNATSVLHDLVGLAASPTANGRRAPKWCTWEGNCKATFWCLFFANRPYVKFWAEGEDGEGGLYKVEFEGRLRPTGSDTVIGGLGLGFGRFTINSDFEGLRAKCEWPVQANSRVSISLLGYNASVGPVSIPDLVAIQVGDFDWAEAWAAAGTHIYLFVSGSGGRVPSGSLRRTKYQRVEEGDG